MYNYSIDYVKNIGLKKGLCLLSTEYKNLNSKLIWKDKDGYLYYASFNQIKDRCPYKFAQGNIFKYENMDKYCELNNLPYHYVTGNNKNSESKLVWIDNDGYLYTSTFENIRNGRTLARFDKNNPYTILNIQLFIELNNRTDVLISDEYSSSGNKNKEDKLHFKCQNGHDFYCDWNHYQSGRGCRKCKTKFINDDEYQQFITGYYGDEYTLLSKYTKSYEYVTVRHNKCGRVYDVEAESFSQGHGCSVCNQCRGENHPKWNPNITDEEREKRRSVNSAEYTKWRKSVFERDGYRCIICNARSSYKHDIIAHHLNSWDKHINERYDLQNGITLCDYHHEDFHSLYGYGNNTKEQFIEYYNDYEDTEVNNQIA